MAKTKQKPFPMPKALVLKNILKRVVPQKLGRPKDIAKIKLSKGSNMTKDLIKKVSGMKKAKNYFGEHVSRFKK